jgi:hypothetical protein
MRSGVAYPQRQSHGHFEAEGGVVAANVDELLGHVLLALSKQS